MIRTKKSRPETANQSLGCLLFCFKPVLDSEDHDGVDCQDGRGFDPGPCRGGDQGWSRGQDPVQAYFRFYVIYAHCVANVSYVCRLVVFKVGGNRLWCRCADAASD